MHIPLKGLTERPQVADIPAKVGLEAQKPIGLTIPCRQGTLSQADGNKKDVNQSEM